MGKAEDSIQKHRTVPMETPVLISAITESKDSKTMMITECGVYIARKGDLEYIIPIVSIESVKQAEQNIEIITDSRSYAYEADDSERIAKEIDWIIERYHYFLSKEPVEIPSFSELGLVFSYVSNCIACSVEPDAGIIEVLKSQGESRSFCIKNKEILNPLPLMKAVGSQPYIRTVVLESYTYHNLNEILEFVLFERHNLCDLVLKNYATKFSYREIHNDKKKSSIQEIRFVQCMYEILPMVLFSSSSKCPLSVLTFDTVVFSSELVAQLSQDRFSFTPQCLRLINCCSFNMLDKFLSSQTKLKSLYIDGGGLSIETVFNACPQSMQMLFMKGCTCKGENVCLKRPPNLLYINLSSCQWSNDGLVSFLNSFFSLKLHYPVSFHMNKTEADWSYVFSKLDYMKFNSIVSEFQFDGNSLNIDDFNGLITLLETQSTIFSTSRLMFVSLNNPLSKSTSSKEAFNKFSEFFSQRRIWGLSLRGFFNCDSFDLSLLASDYLHFLDLADNPTEFRSVEFLKNHAPLIELVLEGNSVIDEYSRMIMFLNQFGVFYPRAIPFKKPYYRLDSKGIMDLSLDAYKQPETVISLLANYYETSGKYGVTPPTEPPTVPPPDTTSTLPPIFTTVEIDDECPDISGFDIEAVSRSSAE